MMNYLSDVRCHPNDILFHCNIIRHTESFFISPPLNKSDFNLCVLHCWMWDNTGPRCEFFYEAYVTFSCRINIIFLRVCFLWCSAYVSKQQYVYVQCSTFYNSVLCNVIEKKCASFQHFQVHLPVAVLNSTSKISWLIIFLSQLAEKCNVCMPTCMKSHTVDEEGCS